MIRKVTPTNFVYFKFQNTQHNNIYVATWVVSNNEFNKVGKDILATTDEITTNSSMVGYYA